MMLKEMAKLANPPIWRKSTCEYPSRSSSASSLRAVSFSRVK